MLWVRPSDDRHDGGDAPSSVALATDATLRPDAEVALRPEGPFFKLVHALNDQPRIRDALAGEVAASRVRDVARTRWTVLALAALPALLLLELDRELVLAKVTSAGALVADVVVLAYVGFELTRRTPRFPSVAAAGLASLALRWTLLVTRMCAKDVRAPVWLALALSVGATATLLARMPSRERVVYELLAKVGVSRGDAAAFLRREAPAPTTKLLAMAVATGIGLPLVVYVLRRAAVGIWIEAGAFLVYAAVVPELVARGGGLDREDRTPRRMLLGVFAGLALTAAILHGAHWFFDVGSELARCTGKLDDEAKRLLVREAAETSSGVAKVRASTALALVTTVFVPLAEERVYRGLLMRTLVKKYGSAYGLFASAVVFGVAHVGAYEVALYQTVLLGIAFGVAYAEGGILAAFAVHASWNLLLLL